MLESFSKCKVGYPQVEAGERLQREQAGFRSKEECIAQACALREIVWRRKHAGKGTIVVFIDFKKAFDTVPHEALFYRLKTIGVRGRSLKFIKALYRGSTAKVIVGSETTDGFPLLRGVRQGCPMSPVLFDIFIDDLAVALQAE